MRYVVIILVAVAAMSTAAPASAHLVAHPKCGEMHCREASQKLNIAHAKYVCHHGRRAHKRWSCQAVQWLTRELKKTEAALHPVVTTSSWIAKQISVANMIGAASGGDPWPNCPDPYDGGGSWQSTVNCENGGNWYDSPGYYRCGLQFDPMWEQKYGQLCP